MRESEELLLNDKCQYRVRSNCLPLPERGTERSETSQDEDMERIVWNSGLFGSLFQRNHVCELTVV